jgi:hypothetical protein
MPRGDFASETSRLYQALAGRHLDHLVDLVRPDERIQEVTALRKLFIEHALVLFVGCEDFAFSEVLAPEMNLDQEVSGRHFHSTDDPVPDQPSSDRRADDDGELDQRGRFQQSVHAFSSRIRALIGPANSGLIPHSAGQKWRHPSPAGVRSASPAIRIRNSVVLQGTTPEGGCYCQNRSPAGGRSHAGRLSRIPELLHGLTFRKMS